MVMTRYQKFLDANGMTQVGGARFLGISERMSRRYASGETEIVPDAYLMLLAIMAHHKISATEARKLAGLSKVEITDQRRAS